MQLSLLDRPIVHTIFIRYVPTKSYVFVKVTKPEVVQGHQALKNQDFIDHDYLPQAYAFYKQVTERQILDRYGVQIVQKEVETTVISSKVKHIVITPSPTLIRRIEIAE